VLSPEAIAALVRARNAGVEALDDIAAAYCGQDRAATGRTYLRENVRYALGQREQEGLRRYFELAEQHGVVETVKPLTFYEAGI
jgi:hypothetical protein